MICHGACLAKAACCHFLKALHNFTIIVFISQLDIVGSENLCLSGNYQDNWDTM